MRLEGGRLAAHLEEALPDYVFAFEGSAGEVRHSATLVLCKGALLPGFRPCTGHRLARLSVAAAGWACCPRELPLCDA